PSGGLTLSERRGSNVQNLHGASTHNGCPDLDGADWGYVAHAELSAGQRQHFQRAPPGPPGWCKSHPCHHGPTANQPKDAVPPPGSSCWSAGTPSSANAGVIAVTTRRLVTTPAGRVSSSKSAFRSANVRRTPAVTP